MEDLKYPIGQFTAPAGYTEEILRTYISEISLFPERLTEAVRTLNDDQLDTAYRPQGWTIRQVVNHCADSHINAFIRFKLALTEETPIIKPYHEALWAELADGTGPIRPSLAIITAVHEKWVTLLTSLNEKQWQMGFIHPEKGRELKLTESTGSYAWHCNHHLAHITGLKARMGW